MNTQIYGFIGLAVILLSPIVAWYYHRKKYNLFQEKMKIGDCCKVRDEKITYKGKIEKLWPPEPGLGLPRRVTIRFIGKYPLDKDNHKYLTKIYLKFQLKPL
jgi:hypothetical protein